MLDPQGVGSSTAGVILRQFGSRDLKAGCRRALAMGMVNAVLCAALAQQDDAATSPPATPAVPLPPSLTTALPASPGSTGTVSVTTTAPVTGGNLAADGSLPPTTTTSMQAVDSTTSPASDLDPAAAANTAASLPPPAALPGSTLQTLSESNTLSNLGRPDFVRAIWVDANGPALRTPDGVKKLVADVRDAGFDTIYAQVRAQGDALYNTSLAPKPSGVFAEFDPLKALLEEAKAGERPLQVHALLVAFRVWREGGSVAPENHVTRQHPEWITQSDDGNREMVDREIWLDPGIVAVQDHLALIATDLVKNYAIDGIQLDRIRYPELDRRQYPNGRLRVGYAPAAVERYNQEKGKTGKPAPTDREWTDWRRNQVTETVRKIREAVKAVRPGTILSAGAITFGRPPATREEYIAQSDPYNTLLEDWLGWAESGLLDVNVLMNFKSADRSGPDFYRWQDFALANKGKAKLVIGVGGWLNPPRYAAAMMLDPIFKPQADGVAIYGYGDTFRDKEFDGNIALLKPVLNPSAVNAKAAELAQPITQSTADVASVLGKLNNLGDVMNLPAAPEPPATAVAAATTPAPAPNMPSLSSAASMQDPTAGLPALPGTVATPTNNMPSLSAAIGSAPAAATSSGGLPSLPGAGSASASASALPNLPAGTSGNASSGLPSLPPAGTSDASAGLPSLPPAGSTAAASTGLPSLPPASGTATAPASGLPTLPAIGGTVTASVPALPSLPASTDAQIVAAPAPVLPPLPSSTAPEAATEVSGLPSLANATAPSTDPSAGVAIADVTPAAQPVVPQLPDLVSPISPANPVGTPAALPGLETFPPGTAPLQADASVTLEPPTGTPITSVAPVIPGPPTTSLMVPATEARTSINVPITGTLTNFEGKSIATPIAAAPLITPPTVLTPVPGQTNEAEPINVGKEVVLDRPQIPRMDYSERASPYGTPNPPYEIRNYTTANIRREQNDIVAMPAAPEQLEIIVLRSGKEFAGRVLQRGTVWRIQLPNGSILNLPGSKIATVRSTAGTHQAPNDLTAVPML